MSARSARDRVALAEVALAPQENLSPVPLVAKLPGLLVSLLVALGNVLLDLVECCLGRRTPRSWFMVLASHAVRSSRLPGKTEPQDDARAGHCAVEAAPPLYGVPSLGGGAEPSAQPVPRPSLPELTLLGWSAVRTRDR